MMEGPGRSAGAFLSLEQRPENGQTFITQRPARFARFVIPAKAAIH
jgi:hypothetical protein